MTSLLAQDYTYNHKNMKETFLKLYDKNVDSIFRFSLRKTNDRDIAKVITDETFKRMWDDMSAWYSMERQEGMDATLYAIASRLLRQYNEKLAKQKSQAFKFS